MALSKIPIKDIINDLLERISWNVVSEERNQISSPSGQLAPFAMSTAPTGWLLCDGSAVNRGVYPDLFSAIGTTWGAGDGSTTFNLPDLRGAFLRGAGAHGTETDAGGTAFTGPAVGAYQDDQMQGHIFYNGVLAVNGVNEAVMLYGTTSEETINSGLAVGSAGGVTTDIQGKTSSPKTDGINGTPRTGAETRPFGAGVYYCIKI